jgi:hypothetical protein
MLRDSRILPNVNLMERRIFISLRTRKEVNIYVELDRITASIFNNHSISFA